MRWSVSRTWPLGRLRQERISRSWLRYLVWWVRWRSAWRLTNEYLRERKQFGGPLWNSQVLRHRLADMLVSLEHARSAAYRGLAGLYEEDPRSRARAVSSAKIVVSRGSRFVCGQAIQLHGGIGLTDGMVVSHIFQIFRRDLRAVWIGEPSCRKTRFLNVMRARRCAAELGHGWEIEIALSSVASHASTRCVAARCGARRHCAAGACRRCRHWTSAMPAACAAARPRRIDPVPKATPGGRHRGPQTTPSHARYNRRDLSRAQSFQRASRTQEGVECRDGWTKTSSISSQ